jgi:glycerol-3-phosphate dehydrogenase
VTSALSPTSRRAALAAAGTGTHDLVVVGGGVTGAGVALDAAARGLSVVLLEAGDLAVGTSSRSGKTMHGGLRYLEQLNFSLVFGALRERDLTIKTLAPHLVGHEHFLYPLQHQWEKPYVGAGVGLYDAMATMSKRTGGAPHARYLSRKAVAREAPGLELHVEPRVLNGHAGKALVAAARPRDLLVLGTRRRAGLHGWFVGSVGSYVVHRAVCPVVVTR